MLKRLLAGLVSVTAGLLLMQPIGASASVKLYHQRSSALTYHRSSMRKVNDSKVHYVKVPKSYAHVKTGTGINTVRSTAGSKVTFKTRFLLPLPGKAGQRWGNPQAIAISKSGYMYIVYCPTNEKNRGRIVRYDMKRLQQLGVTKKPKLLKSVYVKHNGKYSLAQLNLQRAIKVGGEFDTGHGQSLAYNFKSHALYMWRDNEKSARIPTSKRASFSILVPRPSSQIVASPSVCLPVALAFLAVIPWRLINMVTPIFGAIPVSVGMFIKVKFLSITSNFG